MAKPNYAFAKRQRDLAKKQKKEEKQQRKTVVSEEQPPETQLLDHDDRTDRSETASPSPASDEA
ncbi:hypothetical protein CCR95_09820 [Thiocystis minor]|uniref:hypothetical protein n=1 Tax=Thiocystis minor TaxID=61597 RepID=UPI001913A909|nr:hypothetical protein [Thiocystis minor]MBK5964372.1 hypothetical protein [Thiocystis minor]